MYPLRLVFVPLKLRFEVSVWLSRFVLERNAVCTPVWLSTFVVRPNGV